MISQSDMEGRLRLLRYGLVVLVVVSFLIAILVPIAVVQPFAIAAGQPVTIRDFLGWALLATAVVAVLALIVYYIYRSILQRRMTPASPPPEPTNSAS